MPRPPKKVILFVVEGRSDREALERPLQALMQDNDQNIELAFLVADTDVTSDYRNDPGNIEAKINRFYFEPYFSANEFYYPKDILEVVQICDLDGTFVPEEYCRGFDDAHPVVDGFTYDPPYIYGDTPDEVLDRNRRKAANLAHLLSLREIKVKTKKRPYSVYFFSSNIDHYLHDRLNLISREKLELAGAFADKSETDLDWFLRRICLHAQALKGMTLEESWQYIMEGTNSVKRHTNFNIYLSSLLERIGAPLPGGQ